jgi:hypothetical protein
MYNFGIMLKHLALLAVFGPLATVSLFALNPQGNPANAPKAQITRSDGGSKRQQQSGAQHEDTGTPKTPSVVVQVEAPTVDDHSADRQEEKEIQKKLADYTFWLVAFTAMLAAFTFVLALVGLVQGYFLRQQAHYLQEQARHLQEHSDHLHTLAGAATDNAKAAKEAAEAALKQADHMITSERAWFVCRADMIWDKGEDNKTFGRIGFRYENIGKTPGFITEIGFAVTALNSGQELPEIPPSYQNGDTSQWAAGRGLPIVPGDNMGRRASWEPTQAQLDSLQKEELLMWVHGYVKYRDSFVEQIRETRYCLRLNPHWGDCDSVPFFIDGPPAYNSAT